MNENDNASGGSAGLDTADNKATKGVAMTQPEIEQAVCTPGETTCINGTVHKCNSSGRWFATGQSC